MCIYVNICIYMYTYAYIYTYIYIYIHIYTYVHICIHIFMVHSAVYNYFSTYFGIYSFCNSIYPNLTEGLIRSQYKHLVQPCAQNYESENEIRDSECLVGLNVHTGIRSDLTFNITKQMNIP
jgi:hypothetical protein